MILHGCTRQSWSTPNPYGGASGDDFVFFPQVDAEKNVQLDCPVGEDAAALVPGRTLRVVVSGIKRLGYTFIAAGTL
jgi:hypothetical protein